MSVDDDINDFEEQLKSAETWEARLAEVVHKIVWEEGNKISFENDPESQLSGIDISLATREFEGIQLKTRQAKFYEYRDIFFETVSVVEEEKPGWTYVYDDVVVVYTWLNKAENNFLDGALLLINDDFRLWFNGVKNDYEPKFAKSQRNGSNWVTKGRPIPIGDIPPGFIRYEGFDPKLPEDVVTEQATLGGSQIRLCYHPSVGEERPAVCPDCGVRLGSEA